MQKVKLRLAALANSEAHPGNYVLMLEENDGPRRLPIVIGAFEAQAIAIALERMKPNRPLTHDLFKNALEQLDFKVDSVMIAELKEGVFFAKILGTDTRGNKQEIDARSSDAIALAVRFNCPIYTTVKIMDQAGIIIEESIKAVPQPNTKLEDYSLEELENILEEVLTQEDYEKAAKIRDLMEKKKSDSAN